MFRFVSSLPSVKLKKAYLRLYDVKLLQDKLTNLLSDYPDIKAVLPADISAKRLLIGDFGYLAKVYCAFTSYCAGKTKNDRKGIIKAFQDRGFDYSSHKIDIGDFLKNPANGFDIHNCVYCDLEDVSTFTKANGQKVRRFETEHVLDKGQCPLVALSLYNFVASCGTCNSSSIKGTNTIGETEDEIRKLSPTSEGYDFDTWVKFEVIMINPCAIDFDAVNHPDDYKVSFQVKDVLYQKSIDLFELKSRYNTRVVKSELLKWRELRHNHPDPKVQEFATIRGVSFEEMFEELFNLKLRKREHYPMEKARREVMLMF